MPPFEIDWWPNRIVHAEGALARLPELLDAAGVTRAMVVCGRSVAANGLLDLVREAAGSRHAGTFAEVESHSPLASIERALAQARDLKADGLISLGGGSAIDSAKGIALMEAAGPEYRSYALTTTPKRKGGVPAPRMKHLAIPTTSGSGSEIVPTFGLRDPALGRKLIFRELTLIPTLAVLDPQMTAKTPAPLAAASGMTAVARCVESLYSGRRNPLYAALALQGLRMLARSLPEAVASGDGAARAECQVACTLSAIAANANVSVVHAVGHAVGGKFGLQHGIAHAILLAPAMRFLLPPLGEQQRAVLQALGGDALAGSAGEAGLEAASRMQELVARLPLPQRLREVGMAEDELEAIAEHAAHDPMLSSASRRLVAADIAALLRDAW